MPPAIASAPSDFAPRSKSFRANPYPVYRTLQAREPVHRLPWDGQWLITRYKDIAAVLKDPDFGRASHAETVLALKSDATESPLQKLRAESLEIMAGWAVLQNPPEHTVLRKRMRGLFTAGQLQIYDDLARAECAARLSALSSQDQFDLIGDVAFPVAMRISGKILGIDPRDFSPQFRAWTDGVGRLTDLYPSRISGENGLMVIAALAAYFQNLLSHRPQHDRTGLIGPLSADFEKGSIAHTDVLSMLTFMFAVAHSSTVNLIGNTVFTLLKNPDQLAKLKDDPTLLDQTITEVLRYESPVQSISRTAMVHTQIAGTNIKQGDTVHLVIGAGNRDPEIFSDPDHFDIEREQISNLSFGTGIHTCIGLRLARATTATVLTQLLDKMPFTIVDGDAPDWDEPYLGHGLRSLYIRHGASSNALCLGH